MSTTIEISSSKSLVNRYLILKEGHTALNQKWSSKADDVQKLKSALDQAPEAQEYNLGEGGTTLRFFATYLSTFKGEWILNCKESLLKRPQEELISTLKSLGVELKQINSTSLRLKSNGWKTDNISINMKDSTQILTGLTLAALSKGLALTVNLNEIGVNSDYFEMTKVFVEGLGFDMTHLNSKITIPGNQKILFEKKNEIEPDWSSIAFLIVLGALKTKICIKGLDKRSIQPDSIILPFLKKLGVQVQASNCISPGKLPYDAFKLNVQKSPDLFPVLSTLACFCEGSSKIYGAPQLKNKESNRISKMSKLLSACGYKIETLEGGLIVEGQGLSVLKSSLIEFDVSKDHRLYMATEILNSMGYNIQVHGADSILKSFAEYEKIKKDSLSCFF